MAVMEALQRLYRRPPFVAVVRLYGAIGLGSRFGGPLSDHGVAEIIERAFRRGRPNAVALAINSPGGSASQSALIAARIRRLADEHRLPVYAFCEDAAASGGYWLASAADEIWADENSIIGSIGVIAAGFGLQEAIGRWGIERRIHTAGERKSLLDPFRPERPEDIARLERILGSVHQNFIRQVLSRRGSRLASEDLFNGDVWVGREALDRGLIDGIGHLVPVMKEKLGDRVRFRVLEPRRSLLHRLGATGAVAEALEERALWARFGL
ncbi:MAG TPA: S49 family peptidase [Paracoccaceae bacterium]|nr:S49 family peptidase [Paracoccaceae bacterium]